MKKINQMIEKIPGEYVPFIGIGIACVLIPLLNLIF
jgi:hypothetical protein